MKQNIRSMSLRRLIWQGLWVMAKIAFYAFAVCLLSPFLLLAVACFGRDAGDRIVEPIRRYKEEMGRLADEVERRNREMRAALAQATDGDPHAG